MKKWKIQCSSEGEILYCEIYRDGENVGMLSGLKDGTLTIDVSAYAVEMQGGNLVIYRNEKGPVKSGNITIFHVDKPPRE